MFGLPKSKGKIILSYLVGIVVTRPAVHPDLAAAVVQQLSKNGLHVASVSGDRKPFVAPNHDFHAGIAVSAMSRCGFRACGEIGKSDATVVN